MTDPELGDLIRRGESDRVEWKQSSRDREDIKRSICAMANNLGGAATPLVLAIGVGPAGAVTPTPLTDELSQLLSGFRDEGNIVPRPSYSLREVEVGGQPLTAALVTPAIAPPVRLRGRVYVRIGTTNRQAAPEEERRLSERSLAAARPFDISPVAGASLDDLDDGAVQAYVSAAIDPEVLAENQRSREEQLASLRLVVAPSDPTPTVMGLLVAGRDPRRFLPGAYIQFARFEGSDLTTPILSQHELERPIAGMFRDLDELLRLNIRTRSTISGESVEMRRPDYPIDALRQLARNAVLHRSYEGTNAPVRLYWFDDRIEINSPGGPYGFVNEQNFGQPGLTDYRNPHLAEAMKVLGFVQRFGAGIPIAQRACVDNGNPPPEFRLSPEHVVAIVRSAQ